MVLPVTYQMFEVVRASDGPEVCNFIKKETPIQEFFCNFAKFLITPLVAASESL